MLVIRYELIKSLSRGLTLKRDRSSVRTNTNMFADDLMWDIHQPTNGHFLDLNV